MIWAVIITQSASTSFNILVVSDILSEPSKTKQLKSAKRIVTEDGEVKVVEMKVRGRQTGESQDDYDDEKYADDPDYKPKYGSSIGWDPETDGLGGVSVDD